MSLAVQPLFQAKQRELVQPSAGVGGTRFTADFILAVNRSLSRLSQDCDLATAIAHISSTDATITELNAADEWILETGVTYHLLIMGYGREKADVRAAKERWDDSVGTYYMNEQHELQSDSTNDVIGLGALS